MEWFAVKGMWFIRGYPRPLELGYCAMTLSHDRDTLTTMERVSVRTMRGDEQI